MLPGAHPAPRWRSGLSGCSVRPVDQRRPAQAQSGPAPENSQRHGRQQRADGREPGSAGRLGPS